MKMFLTFFMAVCMVCAVQAQEIATVPAEEAPAEVQVSEPVEEMPAAEVSDSIAESVAVKEAVPAPVKCVALIAAGNVEADLVERVQKHVQTELFTKVTVLDPVDLAEGSFDGQAGVAMSRKTGDHLAVLVLASMDGEIHHGASYPDMGVAVINVAALRPDPMDAELYARRVEKQLMSAGGILLGLEICPNPLCALAAYDTIERLDQKGRNFCPPCQDRMRKILSEQEALLEPVPVE